MKIDDFLFRLKAVRRCADGYSALCPAHDDKNRSLSVRGAHDGKILLHCFAGCSFGEVLGALNLRESDAFPASSAAQITLSRAPLNVGRLSSAKQLPEDFLRDVCLLGDRPDGVHIQYLDRDGSAARQRLRTRETAKDGSLWLHAREPIIPYGAWRSDADANGMVLVEGESDCWTLWYQEIAALGIPGALMFKVLRSEDVAGFKRLWVCREPDAGGDAFVAGARKRLHELNWTGQLFELRMPYDAKDPNDLFQMNPSTFKNTFIAAVNSATPLTLDTVRESEPIRTFTRLCDLLNEPDEEQSWLVDGLLPTSGTSMLVAKPKVGKSVTAQNLAHCVARGELFLGLKTVRGRVLYLALEEKRSEVRRHFRAMGTAPEDDLWFYIAASPADAMEWLVREAQERKPALIIVDTFQRLARVRDLNDYAEVTTAMEPLVTLAREGGAHLLLTHHGKKSGGSDGDAVLGSTALFANVDTLLEMRRIERGRSIRSIQRYGAALEETVLTMDSDTFTISVAGSRLELDEANAAQAILEHLQSLSESADRTSIIEAVAGRAQVKHTAFRALLSANRLEKSGSGKKGDPYLYALSSSLLPVIYKEPAELESEKSPQSREMTVDSSSGVSIGVEESGLTHASHGNRQFAQAGMEMENLDDASPNFVQEALSWSNAARNGEVSAKGANRGRRELPRTEREVS